MVPFGITLCTKRAFRADETPGCRQQQHESHRPLRLQRFWREAWHAGGRARSLRNEASIGGLFRTARGHRDVMQNLLQESSFLTRTMPPSPSHDGPRSPRRGHPRLSAHCPPETLPERYVSRAIPVIAFQELSSNPVPRTTFPSLCLTEHESLGRKFFKITSWIRRGRKKKPF